MVNFVALKTSIYNVLNVLPGVPVFEYNQVPKDQPVHYITYKVGTGSEGDTDNIDNVNMNLLIVVLDHNIEKDTTFVEETLNSVDELLRYRNQIESKFYWQSDRDSINPDLPTVDEYTFRREIQYNLKTYISEV